MENLEYQILGYLDKEARNESSGKSSADIAKAIQGKVDEGFEKEVEKMLVFMSYSDLFDLKELNKDNQKCYYLNKSLEAKQNSEGVILHKGFD